MTEAKSSKEVIDSSAAMTIRDQAVENVDRRRGYTAEFAPHRGQHEEEYDREVEYLDLVETLREKYKGNDRVLIHPTDLAGPGFAVSVDMEICWDIGPGFDDDLQKAIEMIDKALA